MPRLLIVLFKVDFRPKRTVLHIFCRNKHIINGGFTFWSNEGCFTLHGTIDLRVIAPLVESTLDILDEMAPRVLQPTLMDKPILTYTDGAYEGSLATWGAVVLGRGPLTSVVFHGTIPEALVKAWCEGGRKQIISQVELFTFDFVIAFPTCQSFWMILLDTQRGKHTSQISLTFWRKELN